MMGRVRGFTGMSQVLDILRQAAFSLRWNPLRSLLGSLAIAFAVATVAVVITAIGGIATYARTTTARAFGSDTFVLAKIGATGQVSRRELAEKQRRHLDIRRADIRFLVRNSGDGVLYAPTAQRVADVVRGGRRLEGASINGTTASLDLIRDLGIARGRFFLDDEDQRASFVAIIGAEVADTLFPVGDPLGQTIRVGGRGFQIIGVLSRVGNASGPIDRYVWMPLTAFERVFGSPSTLQVFARARDVSQTAEAQDYTRTTMRARRQLSPGARENFDMLSPDAARGFVASIAGRLGAAAIPISMMALLAGIVVITNTTLVSVTQRTREIGVRRAIGASRTRVVLEVLTEAVLISLIGGAVGLLMVFGLVSVFSTILAIPFVVEWTTVAIGIGSALAAGLVSGWYPARRAAGIQVVAALRSE